VFEGVQNGVKSFSDGAFLFLLTNVLTRFIAVLHDISI
jgi:hypothetical protein